MTAVVLAVDGGNSKTDLALVGLDGQVLSVVRGPLSSPHHLGLAGCLEVLQGILDEAVEQAGLGRGNGPVAEVGVLRMAGVDFPAEEDALHAVVSDAGGRTVSRSATTPSPFSGPAPSAAGVSRSSAAPGSIASASRPTAARSRFPALGEITGDWGGGYDVGMAAVSAAARSEDGRGPRTSLEHAVPAHFGLRARSSWPRRSTSRGSRGGGSSSCAARLRRGCRRRRRRAIVSRLADEVVALARAALNRLELTQEPVEVVLGGGLLQAADGPLSGKIAAGLAEVGPRLTVRAAASSPVVGAALLGLDELAATPEAQERLRRELTGTDRHRP